MDVIQGVKLESKLEANALLRLRSTCSPHRILSAEVEVPAWLPAIINDVLEEVPSLDRAWPESSLLAGSKVMAG